jgi:hypothetical protein
MWTVLDASGQLRALKVPACYVPQARVRLLSTASLLQSYPGETISMEAHQLTLSGIPGSSRCNPIVARVNPSNNLPMTTSYLCSEVGSVPEALNAAIAAVSSENHNLSNAQKELVRFHNRLGHLSHKRLQSLMRSGTLAHSEATRHLRNAACKLTELPKCAACQFGKQKRRATPGERSSIVGDIEGMLRDDHLAPGQRVHVDHFVCSTEGRLFGSRGKTSQDDMCCGGCIFVDHASSCAHVECQALLTAHETLQAKTSYELMSCDLGVIAQSFLTDNGSAFASKEFASELAKFKQVIRFAGTGAHHHNAIAERNVQTVMAIACTMMLHSAVHWSEAADACLWPMAVQHAVFLHDHMPNDLTGVSPHDAFTRSWWEQRKFHDLHVWGCPVHCLEKATHDGKKLPRWKPRSHGTMHMGLSAKHASTVPLVLNSDSGHINSQFNIVFDDWFATVTASMESLPHLNSPEWSEMFGESTFQFSFDDEDDNGEPTVEVNADLPVALARSHNAVSTAMDKHRPSIPLPMAPVAEEPLQTGPSSPLLVETVDEPAFRPAPRSIVSPPREPPSPSPREPSSPSPREPVNPGNVRWKIPLDAATRPRREIRQESTPQPQLPPPVSCNNNRDLFYIIALSPHQLPGKVDPRRWHCKQSRNAAAPVSSSLRRSSRSARGQSPNRLIQGNSDQTHLGKGPC